VDDTDEFVNEPVDTACSVRRPMPHPCEQHFTSPSPGRQQRVIAQHSGVAVAGRSFLLAVDLTDRGVQIDDQTMVPGAGTELPGTGQHQRADRVELAGVTERERA
jgi:hypothetical protein